MKYTISAFVGVQYSVNLQNARCNNKNNCELLFNQITKKAYLIISNMCAYFWGASFNTTVWGTVLTFCMFTGSCKSCYMFLVLTIEVVWDVRLCRWVSSSRRHEASWCFDLQCLTVKTAAVRSSETYETAYPTTCIFGNAALRALNVTFSLQCRFCTQ
jgi:hypothetical protein